MPLNHEERNRDPRKRTVRDRVHALMKHHGRKVALAIAVVFAFILTMTVMESAYAFQEMRTAYTDLTSELSASKTDLEEARQELQASVDETEALLDATTEDQVYDPAVLSDTAEHLTSARTHLSTEPADAEEQPHWLIKIPGLRDAVDENTTTAETMRTAADTLDADQDAINQAMHRKQVADARAALTDLVETMRTSLADSEGQVQDESTREALSTAIQNAESLLANESADDLTAYQSATDELNAAKASVDESVAAKKAAEKAARKAEEERRARGSAAQDANATDTWHVTYYNAYGTDEADANGAVTQWADHYFIAHDWSSNGQRIMSKPAHVVVDGQTYHYVSSRVVTRDTTWSQIQGFAQANGGIAFQTCYGANYLITHYEPGL